MSHPPAKFTAGAPEVSGVFRPPGQPAEISKPNGNAAHYLATGR